MTHSTRKSLKVLAATGLAIALTGTAAFAGPGKDCGDKHKAKAATQASMQSSTTQTTVLSAAQTGQAASSKMAKTNVKAQTRKVYSFDDALELCQKKQAADLQACIDYKTGKTQPKS